MKRYITLAIVSLLVLSAFLGTTQAAMQSQQLALQKSICRTVRRHATPGNITFAAPFAFCATLFAYNATLLGISKISGMYQEHIARQKKFNDFAEKTRKQVEETEVQTEAMAQPTTVGFIDEATSLPKPLINIVREYIEETHGSEYKLIYLYNGVLNLTDHTMYDETHDYVSYADRDNFLKVGLRPEFTLQDFQSYIALKLNLPKESFQLYIPYNVTPIKAKSPKLLKRQPDLCLLRVDETETSWLALQNKHPITTQRLQELGKVLKSKQYWRQRQQEGRNNSDGQAYKDLLEIEQEHYRLEKTISPLQNSFLHYPNHLPMKWKKALLDGTCQIKIYGGYKTVTATPLHTFAQIKTEAGLEQSCTLKMIRSGPERSVTNIEELIAHYKLNSNMDLYPT